MYPREHGLALVCALVLMLGALILGASIARTAFGSMAAARTERERMVARAAAGMALADAEADIGGAASPSPARAAWFAGGSGGFADGCGTGSQDLGLCLPAASPLPPAWQAVDLAADDGTPVVPYGRYTGAVLATGGGVLPARLPGYLIEKLAPAGPAPPPLHHLYRITAIGFGTRATTQVVLQAIVRRPAAAAPPGNGQSGQGGQAQPAAPTDPPAPGTPAGTGPPTGRISWREIPNWPELHARALH
ncbi:pilus assembly protein [Herbaspirillum sp. SJZ107]|uniref:pilus assembly protein n=1 Tax=Herbaspirillum sp. SJZ107 TaxID=2572881 RepID=UPI00114E3FF0|nr:pilus assembly protein [Herbaspirillum sp. SJZ107]TQK10680.1 type IV pilus assembly protein PilX [Herbaspirillum sp. SJZ107]